VIASEIKDSIMVMHADTLALQAAREAQDWPTVARVGVRIALEAARVKQLLEELRDAIR